MTAFYLASSGVVPGIQPPFTGYWNITTDADRAPLQGYPNYTEYSDLADKVINVPSGSSAWVLARQFVSPAIPGQRITNPTLTGPVRAVESDANINAIMKIVVSFVLPDGTYQTNLDIMTPNSGLELDITPSTRNMNNAVNNINYQSRPGMRIIVEYGVALSASTAAGTVTFRFGFPQGVGDFGNGSGLTTDLRPWIGINASFWNVSRAPTNVGMTPHPFQPGVPR